MSWYEDTNIVIASPIEKKIKDVEHLWHMKHLSHYYSARQYGATHDNFMEAYNRGLNISNYTWGLRYATHKQLMEVTDAGFKHQGYTLARQNGLSHKDTLDALKSKLPITLYSKIIGAGATKSEFLDAKNKKYNMSNYSRFRCLGANHKDAMEACQTCKDNNIGSWVYTGPSYFSYGTWSQQHDNYPTVAEQTEAIKAGININTYKHLRSNEAAFDYSQQKYISKPHISHNDIMTIHNDGYDLNDVLNDIKSGHDMTQILGKYSVNPYDFAFNPNAQGVEND
jgi:hypothetical protein